MRGMTDQTTEPTQTWDPVPVVMDYYDAPLIGVAHYQGTPHAFLVCDEIYRKPTAQEQEEWGDDMVREWVYDLFPVPADMLDKILEKQAIFERWHQAWSAKRVGIEQHPALPEDRERYDELKAEVDPWKEGLQHLKPAHTMIGHFSCDPSVVPQGHSRWQHYQVLWQALPGQ